MNHNENGDILITRRHTLDFMRQNSLKKVLGAGALWGLGTGTVIPGIYMGWNRGFAYAERSDFLIAFGIVCIFFALLIKVMGNFSESIPYAGGPYGFVRKGLGRHGGYAAGMAELVALMAVAAAVLVSFGDYLNYIWPGDWRMVIAAGLFLLLVLLHISGLRNAALFQLVLVGLGISAVVMFLTAQNEAAAVILPMGPVTGFGILQALPYTIWFFVCIETVTMAAEESRNPQKTIRLGLISSFLTVGILVLLMLTAVTSVTPPTVLLGHRYPLLEMIRIVNAGDPVLPKVFATMSLSLILSGLGGLMVGFSRLTYALSRAGYIGPVFNRVTEVNMTPIVGIMIPAVGVVVMAFMIRLDTLLFMANMSAVVVYVLIFISGYRCSVRDGRPLLKACSLAGAVMGMILLGSFLFHINWNALGLLGIYGILAFGYFWSIRSGRLLADAPEEVEAATDEITVLVRGR